MRKVELFASHADGVWSRQLHIFPIRRVGQELSQLGYTIGDEVIQEVLKQKHVIQEESLSENEAS